VSRERLRRQKETGRKVGHDTCLSKVVTNSLQRNMVTTSGSDDGQKERGGNGKSSEGIAPETTRMGSRRRTATWGKGSQGRMERSRGQALVGKHSFRSLCVSPERGSKKGEKSIKETWSGGTRGGREEKKQYSRRGRYDIDTAGQFLRRIYSILAILARL